MSGSTSARSVIRPTSGSTAARLVKERGFFTSYSDLTLIDAQKALFRPGANTLAVSCRQARGGRGIDLGPTLLRAE